MIQSPSPPMIPERFGRYEVLGLLGEGSMGRVYRAFDPLGHRSVAIKTVRPELLAADTAEEYLRRFRREAQAAGVLSHPNIITIFDVGENYFVMELLEGATLQAVLRTRGALGLSEALPILGSVAAAIDYAHAKGIIHRDIKPGNLMILPDGRTKIMDFGVAHLAAQEMSVSGQFLGSPAYMAPERILRGDATPLSDLFSFAVVAYESLTGQKPFEGDNVSDVVACVVKGEARAPRVLNPELPPASDEVFRRALAKDPAARYPSAAVFFAALADRAAEAAEPLALPAPCDAAGTPVASATLVDPPQELRRPARWQTTARLGAGAALILLVSVIAGYSLRRAAPASSPEAAVAGQVTPGPAVESSAADPVEPPASTEREVAEELGNEATILPPVRISGETPRYPELARTLRLRGSVTVEMTVTESGEPAELRVLQSASLILEKAALEAVRTWRFEPARRNGAGVRYQGHRVTLSFQP